MSVEISKHQAEGYQISTPDYEGPLDLLLDLIEKAELDITRLALAQVTDQYLEYLHRLEQRNPAQVSAFLMIAARLVYIKSSALLPPSPIAQESQEDEDPGEQLAKMLILYRKFKQVGIWLDERQAAGLRTYLRLSIAIPRPEAKLDLTGITLEDLVAAGSDVLIKKNSLPSLSQVVNIPRVTIREKIRTILTMIHQSPTTTFHQILNNATRLDIVVTFLAVLELIKREVISVHQDGLFSDFTVETVGDWKDSEETPLEFVE